MSYYDNILNILSKAKEIEENEIKQYVKRAIEEYTKYFDKRFYTTLEKIFNENKIKEDIYKTHIYLAKEVREIIEKNFDNPSKYHTVFTTSDLEKILNRNRLENISPYLVLNFYQSRSSNESFSYSFLSKEGNIKTLIIYSLDPLEIGYLYKKLNEMKMKIYKEKEYFSKGTFNRNIQLLNTLILNSKFRYIDKLLEGYINARINSLVLSSSLADPDYSLLIRESLTSLSEFEKKVLILTFQIVHILLEAKEENRYKEEIEKILKEKEEKNYIEMIIAREISKEILKSSNPIEYLNKLITDYINGELNERERLIIEKAKAKAGEELLNMGLGKRIASEIN